MIPGCEKILFTPRHTSYAEGSLLTQAKQKAPWGTWVRTFLMGRPYATNVLYERNP